MLKKTFKNELFAKFVNEMVLIDQSSRKNAIGNKTTDQNFYNHIVYLVDFVNGQKIKDLIKENGYPSKELIGEKSMKNFWLLIQHQDFDLDLQKNCLKYCDFDPQNRAYLTDRVLVNSGKKQIYGTQFHQNKNGKLEPHPIEDRINVDKRRKEVGLEKLADYTEKMRKKTGETKG